MRWLVPLFVCALAVVGVQPVTANADPVVHTVDDGASFVPLAPLRVLDTRDGTGTGGKVGPIGTGLFLDLSAQLPPSATAVVVNLTGTQPSSATYITVAPSPYYVPDVSNLNLNAGETRANQVTVALLAGQRQIVLNNFAGTVHLVADLAGYYTTDAASRFSTTPPTRVLDTRAGAPVGPASTLELDLSGVVPDSATSVTFNLTGTEPTRATYVIAFPSGTTRRDGSNLNLVPGQTAPNLVTVALGANRRVTLYNNVGSVHLIVDLAGYYATDRGHRFFPVAPVRAFDTRTAGAGPVGPGQTRDVDLATRIAPSAAAAVLSLTGAGPTSVTFVTAYSTGTPRPITSNLNLTPGHDTANSAVVALGGTDARMTLYNNLGSTQLIVDVAGFFATPTPCTSDCVYAWGGNMEYGSTPVRRPWLSGVTSVAAGLVTAYALRSNGTVWSWGDNQFGQLGAGGTGGTSTMPLRVSGLSGVTAVAAGTWAGYALKSDGTVWSWGWNESGQLGRDGGGDSNVPVQVYGLTGVTAIAATHQTAYALKSDGTVWAWGNDVWGGRGSGSCPAGQFCPPGTPVRVALPLPGNTKITAIAAGGSSTAYALRSDGTAWAWGRNWRGETGTGASPRTDISPSQVVGLTNVVTIAGGPEVGYAVTSDGKVWAWGDDYWGTLGSGIPCTSPDTACQSNVPVQVQGLTGPVTITSGGTGTTFARKPDGSVWAWGYNGENGNLGNGTTGACPTLPMTENCRATTPVHTTITGASRVAAGALGQFALVH
jgi:alpha-tubulin suppressor-like RCC1 family protein